MWIGDTEGRAYEVEGDLKARWTHEVIFVLCMIDSEDKIENGQAMMEVKEMGSKRREVRWREGVERETKQKRQGVKTSRGIGAWE